MDYLQQSFSVHFEYKVFFTSGAFEPTNKILANFLTERSVTPTIQKMMFVIDENVADAHPRLIKQIPEYFSTLEFVNLIDELIIIPGGEAAKNNEKHFMNIIAAVNRYGIDRHSYLAAIGGGSVLDVAGYAAAISHRGIKHIRMPSTVLSQNDSGVGVKNGVNYFGKKNFLGTFSPPSAVINDDRLLVTLAERDWRSGIAEAIKVALIRDADFFEWIEQHAEQLTDRESGRAVMNKLIRRCAELHVQHIAGGDPFESGSSRPLDFGHWSAHKLEQLTDFDVLHGEAVAMGIALDSMYAALTGLLDQGKAERIILLLLKIGFDITHPQMQIKGEHSPLLTGLKEFREHLGGRLTIMLLKDIGAGQEVHEMNTSLLIEAGERLSRFKQAQHRQL